MRQRISFKPYANSVDCDCHRTATPIPEPTETLVPTPTQAPPPPTMIPWTPTISGTVEISGTESITGSADNFGNGNAGKRFGCDSKRDNYGTPVLEGFVTPRTGSPVPSSTTIVGQPTASSTPTALGTRLPVVPTRTATFNANGYSHKGTGHQYADKDCCKTITVLVQG